jgi:hypothetical protein
MRLPRSLFTLLNIYALLLAVIMIWPVAQLILSSVTSDLTFPPRYFSTDAFNNIFWPAYFQAMSVSLRMGFWSTILICLPAAYALERRRFPGRSWLSALIFVPAVFPTITYAIAIGVYLALYMNDLRGSFAVIVVATATGAIPLVVRTIQGSLATSDPVYEEAALVMGASPIHAAADRAGGDYGGHNCLYVRGDQFHHPLADERERSASRSLHLPRCRAHRLYSAACHSGAGDAGNRTGHRAGIVLRLPQTNARRVRVIKYAAKGTTDYALTHDHQYFL